MEQFLVKDLVKIVDSYVGNPLLDKCMEELKTHKFKYYMQTEWPWRHYNTAHIHASFLHCHADETATGEPSTICGFSTKFIVVDGELVYVKKWFGSK